MKLTLFLITLMLAGFVFAVLQDDSEAFVDEYGFSGNNMLERPWVLITAIFLHADIEHLLSNIIALFFFGIAVESEIGKFRTLLIFLLGAVVGDLVSLLVYPMDSVAIGASAGIFALIGMGTIVKPFDLSFYPYFIPIPLGLLGIMYAVYNAIGFVSGDPNVSYISHFGGLGVGLAFGFGREGWKKGLKIILFMLLLMLLLPYLWGLIRILLKL